MEKALDFEKTWTRAFMTPMNLAAYQWAAALVASGGTGGVLYAPPRIGKTKTIELLKEALRSFDGPRGVVESATLSLIAYDRKTISEGGFFDWILLEVGHAQAGKKMSTVQKRHCACEYLKGIAASVPSGRVILFVDEAQFLEQSELGWFADLFNKMGEADFRLVPIFVGSFLLEKWRTELRGQPQQHVRARFFTDGHRLWGLKSVNDFKACLRHYDRSLWKPDGEVTITEAYLPTWYASGGRLEGLAENLYEAFRQVAEWRPKDMNVPMRFFTQAVRRILDYGEQDADMETLKQIIVATGFDQWLLENEAGLKG